ncbi:isoleucine--tRNA ligase [Kineosporia sp. J2-2]|uniref:Isoleucine--tRNA ligase n=1 Tax=Kineosporia corallincola TaxID=2835133 RepID=A0ABS5TJL6_9ACTN|nr:isoleucine--tRNA ligase [Kineosporia corallincola]MBT0771304.1 isoleucine--tRNA ligase [Kineosporia corallincola]
MAEQAFATPFASLPTKIDLPATDHKIIDWWKQNRIFERSLERTKDGASWVFYEGPPTANGAPGTHHVEARVFKDLFPRYRTMKGYAVPRQAGWDCHGLPVELAVEKELGLSGKPDIEKVGVAFFNERCRESVTRHVDEFEKLTERMGYWIDLDDPYETMSPEYVDSVWWSLAKIYNDGRLSEDFRVTPYCPRCGTALSDHEVAQGYENVKDPSVYVRFPLVEPLAGHADAELLIWTTTPWTLVSNTAVAVHPDVTYQLAKNDKGTFVVAEPLRVAVLGEDSEVLAELPGRDLENLRYKRPFDLIDIPDAHRVVLADYVTTGDGTGLVHQAPAFGADDLLVARANGLPVVNPVAGNGHFKDDVPMVGGLFFKDADEPLIMDMKKRGVLFRSQRFEHSYPHCWRCHTPLMYYAQPAWYIRTTTVRQQLLRENEQTNWYPDHIKHGRFGDWLENNIDWAVSRTRYWGTPLPLWRCTNDHVTAIGSRKELGERTGRDLSQLDPHRPFVDEITFACADCGETATRVPEVIDAWYDSGAMPFAAIGYPHVAGSEKALEKRYPAQYICEAIDQTRGWFYSLMAVGTLVFDRSPYENVVCLGHIMAEDGRKMSKHLGNILAPIPLMDAHGADALRWFMACSGSPWSPRRVGPGPLDEITRKLLMTYWNTASFFSLYASHVNWDPSAAKAPQERNTLDRWVLGELHALARDVDQKLENYDTAGTGRVLGEFVDDLSNWYVRRSRQRFWDGDMDALVTLYECLDVLTRLLAPIVPFITEEVWQLVVRPGNPGAPESVHLADWPVADVSLMSATLSEEVRTARNAVEAGRAARKASKVRVRQPLAAAYVGLPAGVDLPKALLDDIAEELNVKNLDTLASAGAVVDVEVKPNFRALGKRFGKQTQGVAKALAALPADDVVAALRSAGSVQVDFEGSKVDVNSDEVVVTELPRSGWVVETQRGVTIALDTEITPELEVEGLARDVVRVVQQARRDADLDISDRIRLVVSGPAEVLDAVRSHQEFVAGEVLADAVELSPEPLTGGYAGTVGEVEATVSVTRA